MPIVAQFSINFLIFQLDYIFKLKIKFYNVTYTSESMKIGRFQTRLAFFMLNKIAVVSRHKNMTVYHKYNNNAFIIIC